MGWSSPNHDDPDGVSKAAGRQGDRDASLRPRELFDVHAVVSCGTGPTRLSQEGLITP